MRNSRTFLLLAIVLSTALPLLAALTGDIQGTVFDPKGLVIADAKIIIRSVATGATRDLKTDSVGEFTAQQLDVGTYEVRVEMQGFRVYTVKAEVRSGEITRLNITLDLGPTTEVVTVEGSTGPTLDVATAQISTSLDTNTLRGLPSIGRDPVAFAALSPGIVPVSANNPFLGSGSFNSNGQRGRGNNITIDNVTATDISTTGSATLGTLSLDSIQELKVITNNFSAEFGRNAGAQVQIITKGGTNEYHGSVYWFHQNAVFNARDFFDTSGAATPFIQNQWGFVVGGPIIKNHTFASGHYEGIKTRGAGDTRTATVLQPADVAAITDPTSKALFAGVGAPQSASGTITSSAPSSTDQYAWSLRIDQTWRGGKDSISGRYGANPVTSVAGLTFINSNLPNQGSAVVSKDKNFSFSHTHGFSPSVINQFRFAFGRSTPNFTINSTLPQPFAPTLAIGPNIFDTMGVSNILPQGRTQNTFQYSDSLSWSVGRHALKFGGDVFRYQLNSVFDANFRGTFTFGSLADFQQGKPLSYTQRFGTSRRGYRSLDVFSYVQDDVRVTSTFTLNLGLRVESSGGVSEIHNILSNLDRGSFVPLGGGGAGALGTLDLGGATFRRNTNWAPRFGFAWNPNSLHNKVVVRGGYAWAYDYIFLNPITNTVFSAPFVSSITVQTFSGGDSYAKQFAGTSTSENNARAAVGVFLPTQVNFGAISPVDQALKNPKATHWNFGVEAEFLHDFVMKASYVGTKGDFLQISRQLNFVKPGVAPAPATSDADEAARVAAFRSVFIGESGTASGSVVNNRIDPRFNSVTQVQSQGASIFHAFELEVLKRFTKGYRFQASYTYGHAIDNASDVLGVLVNDSAAVQDPRDLRTNRGNSQFDIRHRFVLNHLWELPFGKHLTGVGGRILGGWAFNGIFQIQSGFKSNVFSGSRRGVSDVLLIGASNVRANGTVVGFTPVPDGSAGAALIPSRCSRGVNTSTSSSVICSNTSGFPLTQPLLGNPGTLGRNLLPLDHFQEFDWAVVKNTRITEKQNLQFRWEVFNVFNNTNFAGFVNSLSSASFGVYQSTASNSRQMQASLKYIF